MGFIAVHTEELTISELHDLGTDDFDSIAIEVTRRCEPGAGKFAGARFLTPQEELSRFESVEAALAFIDEIQSNGLPAAIQTEIGRVDTSEDVLTELHYTPDSVDPDAYFEASGMSDPFNLTITPIREYAKEVEITPADSEHADAVPDVTSS